MIDYEKEKLAFEKVFPKPDYGLGWHGTGYHATEYNAWSAQDYVNLWDGWIKRAEIK